jgi:hypothetical protein
MMRIFDCFREVLNLEEVDWALWVELYLRKCSKLFAFITTEIVLSFPKTLQNISEAIQSFPKAL